MRPVVSALVRNDCCDFHRHDRLDEMSSLKSICNNILMYRGAQPSRKVVVALLATRPQIVHLCLDDLRT